MKKSSSAILLAKNSKRIIFKTETFNH